MKITKVGKNPFRRQATDSDKTHATVQTISARYIAELETDTESHQESNQEQPDRYLVCNIESDNK